MKEEEIKTKQKKNKKKLDISINKLEQMPLKH